MDKSGSIQCGVSSTAVQCPPSQHSSQQCCSVGCRMQVPGRLRDKKLAAISEQIMSAPDCLKHSPPLTIRMRKVMIVNICDAEKTKMMAMRLYLTVKLCQNAQYFLLPKIRLVKVVKSRLEIFQKFICFGRLGLSLDAHNCRVAPETKRETLDSIHNSCDVWERRLRQ